jgi:hypothetical protein
MVFQRGNTAIQQLLARHRTLWQHGWAGRIPCAKSTALYICIASTLRVINKSLFNLRQQAESAVVRQLVDGEGIGRFGEVGADGIGGKCDNGHKEPPCLENVVTVENAAHKVGKLPKHFELRFIVGAAGLHNVGVYVALLGAGDAEGALGRGLHKIIELVLAVGETPREIEAECRREDTDQS